MEALPQISFVVGSGFYQDRIPGVVAAGRNTVIQSVLPQVVRAMTAGTVDAVSSRIQRTASGTAPDASLSFGGATTLSDAIVANGPALQNGTFDPRTPARGLVLHRGAGRCGWRERRPVRRP